MGSVSSVLVRVVIRVCWACRQFVEHYDGSTTRTPESQIVSPDTGFLNTPEATSTPLSPESDTTITPGPEDSIPPSRALVPVLRPRKRTVKRHTINEILSPIEEEMIRFAMAKGCTLRIGITPSLPKRMSIRQATRRESRGVVLSPAQTCFPLVRGGYHEDFRKRGLRL